MEGKKIFKVSTDLEVTVHEWPDADRGSQREHLCELIGNGCDMVESVRPKRLYSELFHSNDPEVRDSRCVCMLVDEEGLLKEEPEINLLASWLYMTDRHGQPIVGNVLFVGACYRDSGIDFCELHPLATDVLKRQLEGICERLKSAKV